MVVDNPLTDEQQDALDAALDAVISGSYRDVEVATVDGDYDFEVTLRETRPKPKMRSVTLKLVWHDDESDWEVAERDDGYWRS